MWLRALRATGLVLAAALWGLLAALTVAAVVDAVCGYLDYAAGSAPRSAVTGPFAEGLICIAGLTALWVFVFRHLPRWRRSKLNGEEQPRW